MSISRGFFKKFLLGQEAIDRLFGNVEAAFNALIDDRSVQYASTFQAISGGPIPASASAVAYRGPAGQRLILPAANCQGTNVSSFIWVGNFSTSTIDVGPGPTDTLGGGVFTLGLSELFAFMSDGVSSWLVHS